MFELYSNYSSKGTRRAKSRFFRRKTRSSDLKLSFLRTSIVFFWTKFLTIVMSKMNKIFRANRNHSRVGFKLKYLLNTVRVPGKWRLNFLRSEQTNRFDFGRTPFRLYLEFVKPFGSKHWSGYLESKCKVQSLLSRFYAANLFQRNAYFFAHFSLFDARKCDRQYFFQIFSSEVRDFKWTQVKNIAWWDFTYSRLDSYVPP